MNLSKITLQSSPKRYNRDLDKAHNPQETIAWAKNRLADCGMDVLGASKRIDAGRLDIPVYLGICGADSRKIMPVRKQMGKGSSAAQAEASAIMELVERFSFFSFWQNPAPAFYGTWNEAENTLQERLIPISQLLASVNDAIPETAARKLLNLRKWLFYPATSLTNDAITWLPLDWFRMLGEFNGSSAGNTAEESILQGLAELIERHVCCLADRQKPALATINPQSFHDEVLISLYRKFRKNGINLILKDMSMQMPMPTVAALAWDNATFPEHSEIVLTAGTATTPEKAVIRAITEVAQLAGDFCTDSCYEASGLPKYASLSEAAWLLQGPEIDIAALPDCANVDMLHEINNVVSALAPLEVYAVETTHPDLGIPAHYCIAPGLQFRERDANQSLGLFIGRKLVEEETFSDAQAGLAEIAKIYNNAHFLPFFHGLLHMRHGNYAEALSFFQNAIPLQPDADSRALAQFYAGYAMTQASEWRKAAVYLQDAFTTDPQMKEAANLLGVCHFKTQNYEDAEKYFCDALKIDKGSAIDLANRGITRKFLGKYAAAREDLATALSLDPTLSFIQPHLDEIAEKNGIF